MKRKKKRIWSLLICMVLLWSMWIPLQAEASSNPPVVKRSLNVGQTLTLTYKNKSVKWSTSNKKVAKISTTSGMQTKVTALKKGTASIKAKLNGKLVAQCKITVKKAGSSSANDGNNNNNNNNSSNTSSGSDSGNTSAYDYKSAIDEYFSIYPKYTKISDGNGSFENLNGHAGVQKASFMRTGQKYDDPGDSIYIGLRGMYHYFNYKETKDNSLGVRTHYFEGIGWDYAITLSFNDTTFQTGENCGVLRVLNCSVPGAKYTWSSSDSSVVGINVLKPDISAVKINAKSAGTVTITCKVDFPNGETKTLKSTVNVSDTVGSKIPNGTVDMNRVMERVRAKYIEKDCKWIPDYITEKQANELGYTILGSYSSYDIIYSDIADAIKESIFGAPKKHVNDPEGYIVSYASEIFSDVYFYVEYQGHNDNGVQFAMVGVLSIPRNN